MGGGGRRNVVFWGEGCGGGLQTKNVLVSIS